MASETLIGVVGEVQRWKGWGAWRELGFPLLPHCHYMKVMSSCERGNQSFSKTHSYMLGCCGAEMSGGLSPAILSAIVHFECRRS